MTRLSESETAHEFSAIPESTVLEIPHTRLVQSSCAINYCSVKGHLPATFWAAPHNYWGHRAPVWSSVIDDIKYIWSNLLSGYLFSPFCADSDITCYMKLWAVKISSYLTEQVSDSQKWALAITNSKAAFYPSIHTLMKFFCCVLLLLVTARKLSLLSAG